MMKIVVNASVLKKFGSKKEASSFFLHEPLVFLYRVWSNIFPENASI
jgi:hypothetical protein